MTKERSLFAGFTDYTGVGMSDILSHLRDWRTSTDDTIARLEEHLARVRIEAERLDEPEELERFIAHSLDVLGRLSSDFERLMAELPLSVEERHVEIVQQISSSGRRLDSLCVDYKRNHIDRALKDESLRFPLIDPIYEDTRNMAVDYLDLSNLAHRLKTFVGTKKTASERLTSDDLDALELKPNLFGIGINLNYFIKRIREFVRRR